MNYAHALMWYKHNNLFFLVGVTISYRYQAPLKGMARKKEFSPFEQ
jgi:hypothetical protein